MARDFDDEDLAGLTEAERNQLLEIEAQETSHEQDLQELAQGDDEVDGTQGSASSGDQAGKQAATSGESGDPVPATSDEQAAGNTPAEDGAESKPVQPIYQSAAPDDLGAKLQQVERDRAELFRKYNDGEIDGEEYVKQSATLEQQRDDLRAAKIKADVAAEMTEQQHARAWRETVANFMAEMKRAGFDYSAEANKESRAYLDARVRTMAELHDDSPEGWKALLQDAHMLTYTRFGIKTTDQGAKKEEVKAQSRQPDLSKTPPTLRNAPAAADASISGDEFAHLNALEGIALEKAVAKLTPEQQQRWANS